MVKTYWLWQLTGNRGERHGYVQAVDPRDAFARALTSQTPEGGLLGEWLGIPAAEMLVNAPGNGDVEYQAERTEFKLRVRKVTCPSHARHPDDIVGCGSAQEDGPDDEGLFDCGHCGLFFNPLTAY